MLLRWSDNNALYVYYCRFFFFVNHLIIPGIIIRIAFWGTDVLQLGQADPYATVPAFPKSKRHEDYLKFKESEIKDATIHGKQREVRCRIVGPWS